MKLRGLYAITDSQLLAGKFLSYVEAALEGGVTLLQYRDKSSDEARRLREAETLRDLCERYKTQLIINDDAELAARLNVGVHLGQTDGPLTPARALLGRQAIIGSTCHAQLELAEQAAKEGASYVAFGRFFNSNTKPGAPTCSLELLDQARSKLHLPMLTHINGQWFGAPEAGVDMQFNFAQLVAHAAKTRPLSAGTLVGSGTVANEDTSLGASCFAEQRTVETLRDGKPSTPFMRFGDTVRIEMLDRAGNTVFGAIEQRIELQARP